MAGEVNREEWAAVIRELLPLTKGKKATLARMLGVDPTTLGNWLRRDVSVSEASVRQVAERTNRNGMELLIRVGYYAANDLPAPLSDEQIDEEQQRVIDADLDDEVKVVILRELEAMRSTDKRLLDELAERDKLRRMARLEDLIAQARRQA